MKKKKQSNRAYPILTPKPPKPKSAKVWEHDTVMTLSLLLLNCEFMDSVVGTKLYNPVIRRKMELLIIDMERHMNQKANFDKEPQTEEEADSAAKALDQMIGLGEMGRKLLVALLAVEEVHQAGFTTDFVRLLQKYHVPMPLIKEIFGIEDML